jgi:hypothetical protein
MFRLCKSFSGSIQICGMNYILQCLKWFRQDLVLIYGIHKFLKIYWMFITSYNIPLWYETTSHVTTYDIVIYSSYHTCVLAWRWRTKLKHVTDGKLLIKLCLDLFISVIKNMDDDVTITQEDLHTWKTKTLCGKFPGSHMWNNFTCSTDCKYRTAATLYTLETWFFSGI